MEGLSEIAQEVIGHSQAKDTADIELDPQTESHGAYNKVQSHGADPQTYGLEKELLHHAFRKEQGQQVPQYRPYDGSED